MRRGLFYSPQVVLLFLFCNTLALIINIVELFEIPVIHLNYLTDASNVLVMLNSSANCLIYIAYSSVYMHTLKLV